MREQSMFVQFPHPGPEHKPSGREMPWSPLIDARGRRVQHARKFLKVGGDYLVDGALRTGPLAFWGEWEPQSRVLRGFSNPDDGFPRWLHDPYWHRPDGVPPRQNTDPLVFGDHFLYSNCRQQQNRNLRKLAPGSVILFGSKKAGELTFVLDTVFVVGEGTDEFTVDSSEDIDCPDWVQEVVFRPLRSDPKPAAGSFSLYRSRTYQEDPVGPFSFVPCRPCKDELSSAFVRPMITLGEPWLKPSHWRGARCTVASESRLTGLWDEVVRQVEQAGLALGVRLPAPPEA